MCYPLFDSGYTLWAADLETQLSERHGVSVRGIGVEIRMLLDNYYRGLSVPAVLEAIEARYQLSRA
jgi:hypothetical protein